MHLLLRIDGMAVRARLQASKRVRNLVDRVVIIVVRVNEYLRLIPLKLLLLTILLLFLFSFNLLANSLIPSFLLCMLVSIQVSLSFLDHLLYFGIFNTVMSGNSPHIFSNCLPTTIFFQMLSRLDAICRGLLHLFLKSLLGVI